MTWKVIRTDKFSREFKKFEEDKEFVDALDKKILRLQQEPSIGGYLAGRLHGYKSVRLLRKFRIIFKISEEEGQIYLIAIDHRGHDYERFY